MGIPTAWFVALAVALASPVATALANGAGRVQIAQADSAEIAFWESVKDTTDPHELEAYLAAYPQGTFASLAKIRLQKLGSTATPPQADRPPVAEAPPSAATKPLSEIVESIKNQAVTIRAQSKPETTPVPDLPEGSPFGEFFDKFFADRKGAKPGSTVSTTGSGFIYSSDGHVVTMTYVVEGAERVDVQLADGRTVEADVVGTDPKTTVALLKLRGQGPFVPVSFGNSDDLKVGERIIVIGNTGGLAGTVKTGIVSGLHRDVNAGPYDDYIQTDQDLATTQAGAPMFDGGGNAVAMVSLKFKPKSGASSSLAVPIKMVRRVADDLMKYGETQRGWLGVRIQKVTDDIAESLQLKDTAGALVASVTAGGPAVAAGLQAGDVIVTFDGSTVATLRELPRLVANTPVGKTVDVEIVRGGKTQIRQITIGRLERARLQASTEPTPPPSAGTPDDAGAIRLLGMTLEPVTPLLRTKFSIPAGVSGGVVTTVSDGSPAQAKGIVVGDVIIEVSQSKTTSPSQIAASLERISQDGKKTGLVMVQSGDDARFLVLPLDNLRAEAVPLQPVPDQTVMSVKEVQRHLSDLGYDPGPVDGKMGTKTRSAIQLFQKSQPGMAADGQITADLSRALRAALGAGNGAPSAPAAGSNASGGRLQDLDSLE